MQTLNDKFHKNKITLSVRVLRAKKGLAVYLQNMVDQLLGCSKMECKSLLKHSFLQKLLFFSETLKTKKEKYFL